MRASVCVVAGLLALGGCGPSGENAPATGEGSPTFIFMNEVMQPRAEVIWNSAGYVISADGERDLSPTTDEGWAEVRQGALDVIDAGETLKTADFARDHENWDAFAEGIIGTGGLLRDAAEAQDSDGVFELGGQLYRVCVGCHQFYQVGEFEPAE